MRFKSEVGLLNVEDLWDLPLVNAPVCLDTIAINVNKRLKDTDNESFVSKDKRSNPSDELRLAILKHIIKVKLDENEAHKKAAENAAKKQKLLELIHAKEVEEISNLPIDELKKMVADL